MFSRRILRFLLTLVLVPAGLQAGIVAAHAAHAEAFASRGHSQIAAGIPGVMHHAFDRKGAASSCMAALLPAQRPGRWFLIAAALAAMSLGALHALEGHHRSSIMTAHQSAARTAAGHHLLAGMPATAARMAGTLGLGAIAIYGSHALLPAHHSPWLGVILGSAMVALGALMFLRRWLGKPVEHAHAAGPGHGPWHGFGHSHTGGGARSLIPGAAALAVLLGACTFSSLSAGLFMVSSFVLGFGAALAGHRLSLVHPPRSARRNARRSAGGFQTEPMTRQQWLPVASAGLTALLGAAITMRAFAMAPLSAASFPQQKPGPALLIAAVGLVLGVRHSTDTDHVVAISTIVTRQRGVRGAALIGGLWGLGHTLTIFIVGCFIILGGVVIPPRVGLSMEFSVGLMLILLGLLNLSGAMQKIMAWFREHNAAARTVLDYLASSTGAGEDARQQMARVSTAQAIRQWIRPLAIGLVHGLAGSAAVALLVLSTIHKPLWAIVYLVIFGAGTMLGMVCMTMAMSMPLAYASDRLPRLSRYLTTASGIVSVGFGSFLVYQLGFIGGLFTSHPHWTPR